MRNGLREACFQRRRNDWPEERADCTQRRKIIVHEADPFVRTFLGRPEALPDLDAWRDLYVPPFGHFLIALDRTALSAPEGFGVPPPVTPPSLP